jgi:hypothetical protein
VRYQAAPRPDDNAQTREFMPGLTAVSMKDRREGAPLSR